jgi:hypothetical protein
MPYHSPPKPDTTRSFTPSAVSVFANAAPDCDYAFVTRNLGLHGRVGRGFGETFGVHEGDDDGYKCADTHEDVART